MYVCILLKELKFPQQTPYTVTVSYQGVAELLAARNDQKVSTEGGELKVNNDHTSPSPLHEVEIVIHATAEEENESDESDDDNDDEDDDFKDPNCYLPPNLDSFTIGDVKGDTLFKEEFEKDCSILDSEKKYVVLSHL